MNDEQKISQRYSELGREEPPRHLDDAILSAARGAVESRPAPLVVPTGRRRWYFPLAAAAVIVLAVAVTMHVEREQPDAEVASSDFRKADPAPAEPAKREEPAAQEPPAAAPSAPPRQSKPAPQVFVPDPKPQAQAEAPASPPQVMSESQPAAAADQRARDQDRLESQSAAREAAPSQEKRRGSASGAAASRPAPAFRADEPASETAGLAKLARQSPEQWLLGIDDLKRQGKHEEAEKQLAEFRKRYPNYRIPEAISEKFEKR